MYDVRSYLIAKYAEERNINGARWLFEKHMTKLLDTPVSIPKELGNWEVLIDTVPLNKEDLQLLYTFDDIGYKVASYLEIPITDPFHVLTQLIENGDYLPQLILLFDKHPPHEQYVNSLFKHALLHRRKNIARFLLDYCAYDQVRIARLEELLDGDEYNQVAELFKSCQ
jgi:hypothetical protein